MSNYSIKDLEMISGVKAHTIRIWEKRYGLISPRRTDSNIRLYCDEDVKKLMNVSILLKHGFKISKIAQLGQQEISRKVMEISMVSNGHDTHLESLVVAMVELDESRFEKILSQAILQNGFEETLFNIIYPFFERVGVLWQTGSINPAQEHFITNLIKQKVYVAIDGLPHSQVSGQKTFVVFLPEWELHELGMLVYTYFLKKSGFKVIYLGQKVPLEDLRAVCEVIRPDYLFTAFSSPVEKDHLVDFIIDLAADFHHQQILVTGFHIASLPQNLPSNVRIIPNSKHFRDEILPKL